MAGVVNLLPAPPLPNGKTIGSISSEYNINILMAGSVMVAGNKIQFRKWEELPIKWQQIIKIKLTEESIRQDSGNTSLILSISVY